MPIFLAYTVFAVAYFSNDIERFGNFPYALVTLFAVLNGDVIRETYMTLIPKYPVVGQIFMYSFITLFIYVVLNVFVAIIEESFFTIAQRTKDLRGKLEEVCIDLFAHTQPTPPPDRWSPVPL